jgi:hypothetical protein
MSVNSTTSITELIFFSSALLIKYWGVNMVRMSQKGLVKEQRLVRGVYMCGIYFNSQIRNKTLLGDVCKQFVNSGKIVRALVRKIKFYY